jgi:hypothetical protein
MNELKEVLERLERLEAKVDSVFRSAEKTRKYFFWTLVVTVLTVVLPLVAMVIFIPYFVSTIDVSSIEGLMLQ